MLNGKIIQLLYIYIPFNLSLSLSLTITKVLVAGFEHYYHGTLLLTRISHLQSPI